MDHNLTGKSFLLVCDQTSSQEQITKISKRFQISFPKVSPDTQEIYPEKIHVTIDQVRNLRSQINQKPVKNLFKLIIIYQAHTLTAEAQNALLKLLEEPPSHAVIILQAKNKDSLLPTILSRVEVIKIVEKIEPSNIDIFDSQKELLEQISSVENSQEFLDRLIVRLLNLLLEKKQILVDRNRIINAIESAKDAKKMIEANVDPRFALTNLVFSVN